MSVAGAGAAAPATHMSGIRVRVLPVTDGGDRGTVLPMSIRTHDPYSGYDGVSKRDLEAEAEAALAEITGGTEPEGHDGSGHLYQGARPRPQRKPPAARKTTTKKRAPRQRKTPPPPRTQQ